MQAHFAISQYDSTFLLEHLSKLINFLLIKYLKISTTIAKNR